MFCFEKLYIHKYRVNISSNTDIYLPPYKGSALRGAFGYALKKIACPFKDRNCADCILKSNCIFAYVFETSIPKDDPNYKKYKTAPHPYIIIPPITENNYFPPKTQLSFDFILIGKANEYLSYLIYAFLKMGKIGIGRKKGKFKVINVEACFKDNSTKEIYNPKQDRIELYNNKINYPDADEEFSEDEVVITLETPTRIKEKGDLLSLNIPFKLFIERLCERAALLSFYHCDAEETDYKDFLKGAEKIKIKENALKWYDWERYSARKGRMKLGGLVGNITYAGKLDKFLPLLTIGQYIHVGKATTFGLGKYRVNYVR
jgi:CRISPR-associated endoribonuclease Cas6